MTQQISVAGALDGILLVASASPTFPARHVLNTGSEQVPFVTAGLDPFSLLRGVNLLSEENLGAGACPWRVSSATDVHLAMSANSEWIVNGRAPWILTAAPNAYETVLTWTDPVLGSMIPVRPGITYEASGHFGTHQARGLLRLVAFDHEGTPLAERSGELSAEYRGGRQWDQYQDLAVRLKIPQGAVSVRVEVVFKGASAEPTSLTTRPFIFLLDLALVASPDHSPSWEPLPASRALLALAAAGQGRAGLYAAPLTMLAGDPSASVTVEANDGSVPVPVATFALPDVSSVHASIEGFSGNSVRVQITGHSGPLSLHIDGERAGVILGAPRARADRTRRASVVVAQRYCDGMVHTLEVRDSSGIQVLAQAVELLPAVLTPWESLQKYSSHPFPFEKAPAASYRYQALRKQIEQFHDRHADGTSTDVDARRLAQLSTLHHVLEVGFEKLSSFPRLEVPYASQPTVSVVIPAHNKFNVTYYCLAALLLAPNEVSYEIIVVDDGSSDETLNLAEIAPNVIVCRNDEAQGFVRACNLGAQHARGDFIVLLNNDTEPTVGWLDELVHAFATFEKVGMAGSKLLYPDGRLQDAGGIVWASGNPWNYGRLANPSDPRYSYARQADYLSGAALMVPRTVWDEVGGLSDEFAPAYFEDTDLAFKVRDAGYTTWFVASSVVYHFEGISNGRDTNTTTGLKRFQEINRPKFKAKWAAAVAHNGEEGVSPDLAKDRGIVGRVLFIDHGVPRPDRDAGSFAAIQEMRLVQSLGFKVTFAAVNVAYLGHYSDDLNRLGIETIHAPFAMSIDDLLQGRGGEFDAVYITRYNVADQVLQSVREHAPGAKVLFCNADLHFLREMRTALHTREPKAFDRAMQVREAELRIMREVDVVLSYSEVEQSVILSHNGDVSNVVTCPWVVETVDPDEVPPFEGRDGIAFLGGYLHPPNVEAVEFFTDQVVPRLRELLPDVRFNVYGSNMPDKIRALADDVINPVGYVASVTEVYDQNRIFVAPLLTGAGIKGKVLGALAHGIPSVLSPVAAESTGVRDGVDCVVARDANEWVEAIVRMYDDPQAWSAMSRSSVEFTRKNYSFQRGRELMREAFQQAGIFNTRS